MSAAIYQHIPFFQAHLLSRSEVQSSDEAFSELYRKHYLSGKMFMVEFVS
jgi:hypothetical protein